ncbi:MAG: carboxypeptidase-like regulatory domain-containing protein [Ignavibacteriota bacterium]
MKTKRSLRFANRLGLRNALLLSVFLAFSGIIITSLNSCSSGPSGPGVTATETTTIYGRITDESGASLSGVTVTGSSKSATTDANGIFIIKDVTVPQGRAVIIAKKSGYFNAARAEAPLTNGTTRMALSMMSSAKTATLTASVGGTVNAGAASVKFAPGSFTDGAGNPYTGKVDISARFLDPSKSTFYSFFAGDEQAQRIDGSITNLVSCGVLRVILTDQAGNELKLDATKPATLSCPKPADPKAPATLQLWSFDESLGEWKEEGNATLQGSNYVGTVTHFTDYNFDYCGVENGELSFRIVCNNAPIGGVNATVLGRNVISGPDGMVSIRRVAADGRIVTVAVEAPRNGGLYYLNIPLVVNMIPGQMNNVGDITLNSPCPAELSGTLMCGDQNVEGLVIVADGANMNFVYTKTGKWALQAPAGKPLTVDATDPNGSMSSTVSVPALSSGEQRDIGNIGLCGDGTQAFTDIPVVTNTQGGVIGLSPDGTRLAVFNTPTLTVYDTKTGNILSQATVPGTKPYYYDGRIEFSVDNSKVLLASTYSPTVLFDVSGATGSVVISIGSISGAKLYDDGTKIIAMQSKGYPNPPVINVYLAADGSILKTLHPVVANVNDSAGGFGFIRDEDAVIFPDDKSTMSAHVWSVATDAESRNFAMTGYSYTFSSSAEGLTVAASSNYTDFDCYDSKTGLKSGAISLGTTSRYGPITLTKNYGYSSVQSGGAMVIKISKISDGTSVLKLLPTGSSVSNIAASRNEQYVAAATSDKIRIWKLQ